MPKCRFCEKRIINENGKCLNPECIKKNKSACKEILKCGHMCYGTKKTKCLPCLVADCKEHTAVVTTDDYCNICYVDSLGQSPCIELNCGHIFHYKCVIDRILKKWVGNRITFGYLECPLCHVFINHPLLQSVMKAGLKLYETIRV